jgi:hypothetical protein
MTVPDQFRIEDYFLGHVCAEGLVEDRFGKVRRKFSVTIDGHAEGDEFILDERFQFDDGEQTTRIWHVRKTADDQYEGRADDVIGIACGRADGPELKWAYTMRLPIGKHTWAIGFDDRMFLRDDGVMLNIAEMRKWGLAIGRITIAFRRPVA